MPPLAQQNNNPGDLRFAGQAGATQGKGGFAAFSSPQQGIQALANQVQLNIKNKPNENLIDFASHYAPANDGNNVGQYAANLANQLGVSPVTPISQLESKLPSFVQAIAHNEDDNTPAAKPSPQAPQQPQQPAQTPQQPQSAWNTPGGKLISDLGHEIGLAGGILGLGSAALGGTAPTAGAAIGGGIGEALAPETGGLSLAIPAIGAAIGEQAGGAVQGALGGGSQQAAGGSATDTPLGVPMDFSNVANAVNNALSQTVGGNAVKQEGSKRGIPDVGQAMAEMGLVPSVDSNGNYDKISPILAANAGNAQDQSYLVDAVGQMTGQTSLDDMEREAIQEAKLQLGSNSPDLDSTIKEIQKTFEGYSRQHPQQTDQRGRQLTKTQQFKAPSDVLQMEQYAAGRGRNYALPFHERDASMHIKSSLRKRLSSMAKKEGVKGLDETFKRMETRFLIKKAIKAMPKKASRDFRKEFVHHLVSALGGAAIGKTLGHGILGGTAGYLLASKLEKKRYKSLADKKVAGILSELASQKPKNLLSKTPNKARATKNH